MPYVTIRLEKETCERLKKIGRKGETYDDVINRLLSQAERVKKS